MAKGIMSLYFSVLLLLGGGFSCVSGKRYMIGSPNILEKAILL